MVIIWNQRGNCFLSCTNKPMFGPVVLEIEFGIIRIKMTHLSVETFS